MVNSRLYILRNSISTLSSSCNIQALALEEGLFTPVTMNAHLLTSRDLGKATPYHAKTNAMVYAVHLILYHPFPMGRPLQLEDLCDLVHNKWFFSGISGGYWRLSDQLDWN